MVRPFTTLVDITGPHAGGEVIAAGAAVGEARVAMLLLHGRGASAAGIIGLAGEIDRPQVTYLAPQAIRSAWYPQTFLAPVEANEPWLSSALGVVGALLSRLADAGIPPDRVVLGGFSQGACLAAEFASRNAARYGGIAALSGGLIGAEGTPRDYGGSLDGTPVFIGCSDVDPHIPVERVRITADVLAGLGGEVDLRLYPGMGHTVNRDEIEAVQAMLDVLLDGGE
jgi:phospholipase/carboxylesterase